MKWVEEGMVIIHTRFNMEQQLFDIMQIPRVDFLSAAIFKYIHKHTHTQIRTPSLACAREREIGIMT